MPQCNIPDGYVAVPEEPTPEMIKAGFAEAPIGVSDVDVVDIWRAMLAAAEIKP